MIDLRRFKFLSHFENNINWNLNFRTKTLNFFKMTDIKPLLFPIRIPSEIKYEYQEGKADEVQIKCAKGESLMVCWKVHFETRFRPFTQNVPIDTVGHLARSFLYNCSKVNMNFMEFIMLRFFTIQHSIWQCSIFWFKEFGLRIFF